MVNYLRSRHRRPPARPAQPAPAQGEPAPFEPAPDAAPEAAADPEGHGPHDGPDAVEPTPARPERGAEPRR